MLSFLYPVFLVGALAAAVPVVLHLLRREAAPQVRFSAVRLLRRAPTEQTRRQRLRDLLLLALRVAAILLLAAAFARPYLMADATGAAAAVVVAVDTSLSMGAPGRFERARDLARAAVNDAPAGTLVGLVSFDDRPSLVVEPRVDRGTVVAAIDALKPGYGATRYGPALARAADAIRGERGRVVLITDLQRAGWDPSERASIAPGIDVEITDAGGDAGENLALVDLHRAGKAVVAVVRNAGRTERQARVRLRADGRDIAASSVRVPAGAIADLTFEPAPAAALAAIVDDPGGWSGDNDRHLLTGARQGPRLLVVTQRAGDGAFYVERALAAAPEELRFRTEAVGEAGFGRALTSGEAPAAVLIAGGRAFDRSARDALQGYVGSGGGLVVVAGPSLDPDVLAAAAGLSSAPRARGAADVRLAPVDTRHPIFRAFGPEAGTLTAVRFRRTWQIDSAGWDVIARFTDGSLALAERRVGDGRVVALASDLDQAWNDFPLHPAFVPFLHETIRYVARTEPAPRAFTIGDAPPGAPRVPGIASVDGRHVAINVDPRESDPARIDAASLTAGIGRLRAAAAADEQGDARARESAQRYWRYGLMLMLAALVAEGLLSGGYRFA